MAIADRLKIYIDFKRINIAEFERSVQMSNGSFSKNIKENRSISSDKLEIILSKYPEINPQWLLTGTGSMVITGAEPSIKSAIKSEHHAPPNPCAECTAKAVRISDLEKTIYIQEKLIESLEREIKYLKGEQKKH
jgi:hypothetical protein